MTTKVTAPLITSLAATQITGTITSAQIANQTDPSWLTLSRAVPTGALLMWPVASAPSGWLICNGQAVSRTTFSGLFSLFGITFGAGDGSNTFNLPNYTDRMPIGSGNLYGVAATGGSKDASVISHTHTGSVATTSLTGNVYGISESFASGGGAADGVFTKGGSYSVGLTPVQNDPGNGGSFSINASHNHSMTVDSTGSSGTNANLPPYLGIFFIIKT